MTDHPTIEHVYQNHHLDSTRWERVPMRPGDIVISTAYKAGTTFTQTVVGELIFWGGEKPDPLLSPSTWVEMRRHDIDEISENLAAQTHRRFLKSHVGLDGIPYREDVSYIYVGRDPRDVFMSLWNHYKNNQESLIQELNETPGRVGPPFPLPPDEPRDLWPRWISEGWFEWESDGWPYWSLLHHATTFWRFRHLPNLLFLHYADMLEDLEREVRRIAAFLEMDLPEEAYAEIAERCRFENVKKNADHVTGEMDWGFKGGNQTFFNKGTNGRWREVLLPEDLVLYERAMEKLPQGPRALARDRRPDARLRAGLSARSAANGDARHWRFGPTRRSRSGTLAGERGGSLQLGDRLRPDAHPGGGRSRPQPEALPARRGPLSSRARRRAGEPGAACATRAAAWRRRAAASTRGAASAAAPRLRWAEGRTEQAAALYREATRCLPYQLEAWEALAETERRRGRTREAFEVYLEARQRFRGRGRREEAIHLLREARDLVAWDPKLVVDLARLLTPDRPGERGLAAPRGAGGAVLGRRPAPGPDRPVAHRADPWATAGDGFGPRFRPWERSRRPPQPRSQTAEINRDFDSAAKKSACMSTFLTPGPRPGHSLYTKQIPFPGRAGTPFGAFPLTFLRNSTAPRSSVLGRRRWQSTRGWRPRALARLASPRALEVLSRVPAAGSVPAGRGWGLGEAEDVAELSSREERKGHLAHGSELHGGGAASREVGAGCLVGEDCDELSAASEAELPGEREAAVELYDVAVAIDLLVARGRSRQGLARAPRLAVAPGHEREDADRITARVLAVGHPAEEPEPGEAQAFVPGKQLAAAVGGGEEEPEREAARVHEGVDVAAALADVGELRVEGRAGQAGAGDAAFDRAAGGEE